MADGDAELDGLNCWGFADELTFSACWVAARREGCGDGLGCRECDRGDGTGTD